MKTQAQIEKKREQKRALAKAYEKQIEVIEKELMDLIRSLIDADEAIKDSLNFQIRQKEFELSKKLVGLNRFYIQHDMLEWVLH